MRPEAIFLSDVHFLDLVKFWPFRARRSRQLRVAVNRCHSVGRPPLDMSPRTIFTREYCPPGHYPLVNFVPLGHYSPVNNVPPQ